MMLKFLVVCMVFFLAVNAKRNDVDRPGNKGKNRQIIVGDFCVKIEGKSGKQTIMRTIEEVVNITDSNAPKKAVKRKPCEGKKKITVDFDDLVELDQNGKEVHGSKKHRFKNFAQTDFYVGEPRNVMYQNLSAYEIAFTSKVNSADFTVYIYIFNETGNITNGDEVKSVARGTVKFTVEINNWLFCGDTGSSCKKGKKGEEVLGKYIEVVLKIKGKKDKPDDEEEMKKKKEKREKAEKERKEKERKEKERKEKERKEKERKEKEIKENEEKGKGRDNDNEKPNKNKGGNENGKGHGKDNKRLEKNEEHKKKKKKRPYHCKTRCGKKYDLGNRDEVVLFKTVKVDGHYIAMPEGYPTLQQRGPNHVFVLRFPKGQNISYDPSLEISDEEIEDENEYEDDGSSSLSSTSVLVAVMLLVSFLFRA